MRLPFRCVIHGSLRKHLYAMEEVFRVFSDAGIEVLAPQFSEIVKEEEGFLFFKGEERSDPRLVELLYLQQLKKLGENGFSYFVNPGGYIGKSVSYELGIAQAMGVPSFFHHKLLDHPAYISSRAILSPEALVAHLRKYGVLPQVLQKHKSPLEQLSLQLLVPGSIVTTGAIIAYDQGRGEEEVLLVRTHKWKNRFSVVGGKVRRGERLHQALAREIYEETGLGATIGRHLCTFDQIKHSGYYDSSVQHVFVDYAVRVDRKNVVLNEEAQEYLWIPARHALRELPLEPNARHTLELYAFSRC